MKNLKEEKGNQVKKEEKGIEKVLEKKVEEGEVVKLGRGILYEEKLKVDENSRQYVLNNGTGKRVISGRARNYYDGVKKEWRTIDNSLIESEKGYENKSGGIKVEISKVEAGKGVKIRKGDKVISWELYCFTGKYCLSKRRFEQPI